jgi:pimeloyl-ACP methyl ester carboxylesterase
MPLSLSFPPTQSFAPPLHCAMAAACLACLGCQDDDGASAERPNGVAGTRGELRSVIELGTLDKAQVGAFLGEFGLDPSGVETGVDAYRIEYDTVDPTGAPTFASALIALPKTEEKRLRPLAWLHGTTVYRGDAASVNPASDDRATAFFFASAGYATIAPDYLGLGTGPGPHPYDHLPSEVTAAIDSLRAAQKWLGEQGRELESGVRISGLSQGGPAALALGSALTEGALPGSELAGLAPISGPYDMRGSLAVAAAGDIAFASAYLAYLTVAWNRVYDLYAKPSDAFLPPYDENLELLFDNEHTAPQIFEQLPESLEALFTPRFLDALRTPTGAVERALQDTDGLCSWQAAVPVRLYAARGDRDVPVFNTEYCERSLFAEGVAVASIDVGDVDHSTSLLLSLPLILANFDAIEP